MSSRRTTCTYFPTLAKLVGCGIVRARAKGLDNWWTFLGSSYRGNKERWLAEWSGNVRSLNTVWKLFARDFDCILESSRNLGVSKVARLKKFGV